MLMQKLIRFKDHDPETYSETDKRLLTNGPTMLEHIRKNRAHLCTDLETGIEKPGFTADQAIRVFTSAMDSCLTPRDHSLTVTLMEGIHQNVESAAAAADMDNLSCIAIRCWDRLEETIDEIKKAGRYNRSLCDHKGLNNELGYTKFDPLTEDGRARWMQLRRMIIEYFKIPSSRINQLKNCKTKYMDLKQGSMLRKFITLDDRMAKDLKNLTKQESRLWQVR